MRRGLSQPIQGTVRTSERSRIVAGLAPHFVFVNEGFRDHPQDLLFPGDKETVLSENMFLVKDTEGARYHF